jgi:hypothetical protein
MVVASLALFFSLGGWGQAKTLLGWIDGKRIKPGTIAANRLTASARASLKGQTGEQGPQGQKGDTGPQGVQGPPGPDTGPAAGDLTGSYPNPTIAAGAVTNAKLAHSTLTISPGNGLTGGGSVPLGGGAMLGVSDGGIGTTQLADGAVTNAKLANASLTVTAGTGLTGGGSIALGGSGSLSVDTTTVQSRVSGTCVGGSFVTGIAANGGVSCHGYLAGIVKNDGSIHSGTGFSVVHNSTGNYTVNVPAPTFVHQINVVPMVTPLFNRITPLISGYNLNGDGSLSMTIDFNGVDSYFAFALIPESTTS